MDTVRMARRCSLFSTGVRYSGTSAVASATATIALLPSVRAGAPTAFLDTYPSLKRLTMQVMSAEFSSVCKFKFGLASLKDKLRGTRYEVRGTNNL